MALTLSPETTAFLALLVKATLLLIAAFGGATLLQRAPAGARHLLWVSTLGAVLALPVIASWSPLRLAVLPASWFAPSAAEPAAEVTFPSEAVRPSPQAPASLAPLSPVDPTRSATSSAPTDPSRSEAQVQSLNPWQLLLVAWGAVAALIGAWLAVGFIGVRRIVRRATQLTSREWSGPLYDIADRLGIERTPRLLRSDDVKMPFAAGLVTPTVVLPAESDSWDEPRRRAVLLHELAHIARNDLVSHTLGRVVCAVYWFHPLVWRAARRLRLESERACDDLALSCGERPSSYAEHLLDIVTRIRQPLTPSVAIPMADRKEFEGRMLAILDPDIRRQGSRRQSLAVVTGLAVVALLVGGTVPTAAARAASSQGAADHSSTVVFSDSMLVSHTDSAERRRTVSLQVERPAPAAPAQHAERPEPTSDESVGTLPEAALLLRQMQQAPNDDRAALLMQVLRSDTSASIRRVAAWGLEQYAERPEVAAALARALRSDKDRAVREMAAWALGDGQDTPEGRAALMAALASDTDPEVRESSAWALGRLVDEPDNAVDAALAAALRDDSPGTRAIALWAIGRIGEGKLPAGVAAALGDREARVRQMAAWVIFRRADTSGVPAIERALNQESDAHVRVALIRALGAMGESSASALARLLDAPDKDVRAAVVAALAGRGAGPWPMPMPRPRPNP